MSHSRALTVNQKGKTFFYMPKLQNYLTHKISALLKNGVYALITGGAEGIGKACAHQMALRGIDIFLIDYNEKLLTKTVEQFKRDFPKITVKSKVLDLTLLHDEKQFAEFNVGYLYFFFKK